ncbi:MAG: NAD(P)H-dependent oxidoreductase [Ruminococcus sp.]|nr:NAD(P)H-dependent oxidoreductase [Ruminococcus sp.]
MYVTEYIATKIHDKVGGDLEPIIPEEAYPADYNETADKAKDENDNGARPKFTLNVNPEDYDVIFIGYPIWWYEMPMILDTFFDSYDFSEKTIIPFNTHAGSGDGGTYEDIKELEPNATVLDGVDIAGSSSKSEIDSAVKEWLNGINY